MNQTSHPAAKNLPPFFHAACLIVACLNISSCFEPQDRPIPPLDPSISTAEHAIPVVETSIQPGKVTRMPLGTLYQLVQSKAVLTFDVRPVIFYKMGHIPGAISFPKSNFDADIKKHETLIDNAHKNQTPVVIYCTDLACPDALSVATQLSQRGHDVSVLQGGYEAWKSATQ
jgi:rhodanese-related sulfurtransferase